jgi:SAM-dependent methyltransferase
MNKPQADDPVPGKALPDETAAVAGRYARRLHQTPANRYSMLQPDVWQSVQERQRALMLLFKRNRVQDVSALHVVEVGCGAGGNLLELLRLGFQPEHLHGLELLPDRYQQARHQLPAAVRLTQGDAMVAPVPQGSVDLVLQSTVFSSLLDAAFQQRLAQTMWRWLKPGGAVIWYDFTFNNPRNPDVRGVPVARVRQLFPLGHLQHRRVTLAPPLARALCAWHPGLYGVFNTLPLLRTHVLAWVAKPAIAAAQAGTPGGNQ